VKKNKNQHPLVSILIPAYKPDFFEETLKSAIEQDYPNIEIVISDDCPDEGISKIVRKFPDPRVRYIRNSPARGPMNNYVFLFEQARGDYVKFLNDDDELHTACVSKMVPWLDDSQVTLVTSRRQEVDGGSHILAERIDTSPLVESDVILNGRDLAAAMLFYRLNFVGEPSCMMFRKRDVKDVRPHLMSYHGLGRERSGLGDVGLALNLLEKGSCAYLGKEPLVIIRVFEGQWQNASPARQWSLRSWKAFRSEAIRFGFVRAWDGFVIRYRGSSKKGYVSFCAPVFLRRRWRVSRVGECLTRF